MDDSISDTLVLVLEHDFAARQRSHILQHLVGLSSLSWREHLPDVHEELLRVEEIRECFEVLSVDVHQNKLGLDPVLLGELPMGHAD